MGINHEMPTATRETRGHFGGNILYLRRTPHRKPRLPRCGQPPAPDASRQRDTADTSAHHTDENVRDRVLEQGDVLTAAQKAHLKYCSSATESDQQCGFRIFS